MKKVIVEIYHTGKNFCAHAPILPGCVSTAGNLADMKKNIREAISFHVESSLADGDPIPEVFKGEYELEFNLTAGGKTSRPLRSSRETTSQTP